MTPRERVLTALKKKGKPDRAPFEISWGAFTPRLMKVYKKETGSDLIPDEYFDFDTRFVLPDITHKKTDFSQFFRGKLENDVSFDEWGVGSVPTAYEIPNFKYHPLAIFNTVKQIDEFPWPDLDEAYRYRVVNKKVKEYHERGYAVNGEMYQTIYEIAWLMRGMEQFMLDFYANESVAHAICENITQIRIRQARQFVKTGIDIIRFGDDIVSQQGRLMGKEVYDKFFKWRIKKIIQAAKGENPNVLIFMHSCGKVEDVIDDFVDVGVEILNPLQPECNNLKMIHDKYIDKIAFWGGIGVQSVMPHGTSDEVRAKVKETMDILGPDGGLLLAPAHILNPVIPWENIKAFIEAAKNAWYH